MNLRSIDPRWRRGAWALVMAAAVSALVACAPATDPTTTLSAPTIELEVGIATDCEAGVDVVVVVDGATFTFPSLDLTEAGDADLPFVGAARVPGRRGAPYRVTVTHACDDVRRTQITTHRVEGDERTIRGTTTARASGPVTSDGGM